MSKPNCFECKHIGHVPGSAHRQCKHPKTRAMLSDPELQLMAIFGSVGRGPAIMGDVDLNVTGDPHGIKKGWFQWPFNFDPTWLLTCDGFEAKDDDAH